MILAHKQISFPSFHFPDNTFPMYTTNTTAHCEVIDGSGCNQLQSCDFKLLVQEAGVNLNHASTLPVDQLANIRSLPSLSLFLSLFLSPPPLLLVKDSHSAAPFILKHCHTNFVAFLHRKISHHQNDRFLIPGTHNTDHKKRETSKWPTLT